MTAAPREVVEKIAVGGCGLASLPWKGGGGLISADRLAERPIRPRLFNVPGLIPNGQVTAIGGDGGTGKSTLALQLAVATTARRQWLGLDVMPGPVVYLSAEDDTDELHRRLADMCVQYNIGLDALAELTLIDLADKDALLAVGEAHGAPMAPTKLYEALAGLLKAVRPVLVVIDSAADVYGGNENDRGQVRQFVGLLRRLAMSIDAAVVLLTHPSLSGLSSGSGTSGSTAWSNSVRSRLSLTKPNTEGADPDLRVLTTMKANYAAAGGEVRMHRRAGVFMPESAGMTSSLGAGAARNEIDRKFLTMLATYTAQCRPVSHATGANYAPAMFAKDPLGAGVSKHAFSSAMNRLFDGGKIRIETSGPPSRQRHSLAIVEALA